MKRFFAPNIGRTGRLVRGWMGLALLGGATLCLKWNPWLAAVLAIAGVVGIVEALRCWCFLRACGLKTKL